MSRWFVVAMAMTFACSAYLAYLILFQALIRSMSLLGHKLVVSGSTDEFGFLFPGIVVAMVPPFLLLVTLSFGRWRVLGYLRLIAGSILAGIGAGLSMMLWTTLRAIPPHPATLMSGQAISFLLLFSFAVVPTFAAFELMRRSQSEFKRL